MRNFESVLVTGGAGYIGSVLARKLVESGYNVRVLDSLIFGKDGISDMISQESVELIEDDIRNEKALEKAVKNMDCVIHLAAIVGEPLCNKIPEAARQINEFATQKLLNISKKEGVSRFLYASTCSNYGSASKVVNELTPVNSLSLYSETKVRSESFILQSKDRNFEPCILRFATAFGISPRMRFDLLLQEFIHDAVVDSKIVVFGPDYWRPLVHVNDISNACILALETPSNLISGEIYNVGDNGQNYKKITLAELVQKYIPTTKIKVQELKKDPRNYKVSFDKIKNKLNFTITKTVQDGVQEIVKEIREGKIDPRETEFSNMSRLTENVKIY